MSGAGLSVHSANQLAKTQLEKKFHAEGVKFLAGAFLLKLESKKVTTYTGLMNHVHRFDGRHT